MKGEKISLHEDIWGKDIPRRGKANAEARRQEAAVSEAKQGASVAGMEQVRWRLGGEVREATG